MDEKQKRKNSDRLITGYERGVLSYLYRYLRLAKTRQMHVALSPESCLSRLKAVETPPKFHPSEIYIKKNDVVALDNGDGYEFQAQIRMGWRGYHQPDVNGLIVDAGDGQSLVTVRTYPGTLLSVLIVFMILFCYGSWNSPERIAVCGFLFMLVIFCFGMLMEQNTSLDHIVNQLTRHETLSTADQSITSQPKPKHLKNMQRKS